MSQKVITIQDRIWCELKTQSGICSYIFYPANIPTEQGGDSSATSVQGVIDCDTDENAEYCLHAIANLIETGYRTPIKWIIALDMRDIMQSIFNGSPLKYLRCVPGHVEATEVAHLTQKANTIFAYFQIPEGSHPLTIYESTIERLTSDANTSVWSQISFTSTNESAANLWFG